MDPTRVFYLITYTQGLVLVQTSSFSVRFDGHGLYSARTPTVVLCQNDFQTCNEILYTLVILTFNGYLLTAWSRVLLKKLNGLS
jgi:hypothetical protein